MLVLFISVVKVCMSSKLIFFCWQKQSPMLTFNPKPRIWSILIMLIKFFPWPQYGLDFRFGAPKRPLPVWIRCATKHSVAVEFLCVFCASLESMFPWLSARYAFRFFVSHSARVPRSFVGPDWLKGQPAKDASSSALLKAEWTTISEAITDRNFILMLRGESNK